GRGGEAGLVRGLQVAGAPTLTALLAWLRGERGCVAEQVGCLPAGDAPALAPGTAAGPPGTGGEAPPETPAVPARVPAIPARMPRGSSRQPRPPPALPEVP